jgi:hypothetical protein
MLPAAPQRCRGGVIPTLTIQVFYRADGDIFDSAVTLARRRLSYLSEHTQYDSHGTEQAYSFSVATIGSLFDHADMLVTVTSTPALTTGHPRLRGFALLTLHANTIMVDFICSRVPSGGTRLLAAAAELARAYNKHRLTLKACEYYRTPACTHTLVHFYESRGFKRSGGRDRHGNVNMHLQLGNTDSPSRAYCDLQRRVAYNFTQHLKQRPSVLHDPIAKIYQRYNHYNLRSRKWHRAAPYNGRQC